MNFSTDHDYSQVVSPESLERELTRVRAAAAGGVQGVFGPRSLTWQIDRESAIFFGTGRALLLQLAHPWVAPRSSSIPTLLPTRICRASSPTSEIRAVILSPSAFVLVGVLALIVTLWFW